MSNVNTITYGKGKFSINDNNTIQGISLRYEGEILITDKTPSDYTMILIDKEILIFPIRKTEQVLLDVFEYIGKFKIISILPVSSRGTVIYPYLKRDMDSPEYLTSAPNHYETNIENQNASYAYKRIPLKSKLDTDIIENLDTNDYSNIFHIDNIEYKGPFHIHKDGIFMTGETHNEKSRELKVENSDS